MKHFTCDKCEMPMEAARPMRIAHHNYDICSTCHNKIMEGLEMKGEPCQSVNLTIQELKRKYDMGQSS